MTPHDNATPVHTCCQCHEQPVATLGEVCDACLNEVDFGYIPDDVMGGVFSPPIDD